MFVVNEKLISRNVFKALIGKRYRIQMYAEIILKFTALTIAVLINLLYYLRSSAGR